jgi:hypothetical protein
MKQEIGGERKSSHLFGAENLRRMKEENLILGRGDCGFRVLLEEGLKACEQRVPGSTDHPRWGTINHFFAVRNLAEWFCESKINVLLRCGEVRGQNLDHPSFFLDRRRLIQGIRTSCAFEKFLKDVGNRVFVSRDSIRAALDRLPVKEKGGLPLFEEAFLNRAIEIRIREPGETVSELFTLHCEVPHYLLLVRDPTCFKVRDGLCEVFVLFLRELKPPEFFCNSCLYGFFSDARRGTLLRVAPVIDVALLGLANKFQAACRAYDEPPEKKLMLDAPGVELSLKDVLYCVEGAL